jgi:hypothetical protein
MNRLTLALRVSNWYYVTTHEQAHARLTRFQLVLRHHT